MERIDFLPLGSIVVVRGAIRKTMIISRGVAANVDGQTKVFDYAGCVYPEGLVSEKVGYFNHQDIARVVFEGFSDEDNQVMVENIHEWLKTVPFERANPFEINAQMAAAAGKDG